MHAWGVLAEVSDDVMWPAVVRAERVSAGSGAGTGETAG